MVTTGAAEPPIRVLTADDHPVLRAGINSIVNREPDMEVVGEAETGTQAVELYKRLRPDVMLMDIRMPELSGIDAVAKIKSDYPDAKIVVLTTYAGDVHAQRALKAGASGYILKSDLSDSLLSTIRAVHAGRRKISPHVAEEIALHAGTASLTRREIEILQCISTGASNKVIGLKLNVTEDTVKLHLKSAFAKLGVKDRTEAVTLAARRGFIDITDIE